MRWLILMVLLGLYVSPVASYSHQHCANLTRAAVAAVHNSDWRNLLEVSSDYERECAGIVETVDLANAMGLQAESLFWLSKFAEALSTAERCLAILQLPYCHLGKGRALVGLGRVEGARTALQEAKRSAGAFITLADSQVRLAPTDSNRQLWSARRSNYRGHSKLADEALTLINNSFPDQPPRGQTATGSGIVISKDGSILTNHHVTHGCSSVQVHTVLGSWPAKVFASDAKLDLALLQTGTQFSLSASFRSTHPQLGEPIAVIGFPLPGLLSSGGSVQFGHINALQGIGGDVQRMQISATVQKGNSGGPVFDKGGLLLGVVVEKLDALEVARVTGDIPQNIGFAIRPEVVRSFLRSRGVAMPTASPSTDLSTTDLAKLGKELTVLVTCKL
jgi:S1-C subfamily serine protease